MGPLTRVFLGARPRAEVPADLEARLAALVGAARAAWPTVALADETFVGAVAARIPDTEPLAAALGRLHAADLWLACACAEGSTEAMVLLERRCFQEVDAAYQRVRPPGHQLDDVRQLVREKLFVGADGPPRIREYAGQGELRAWLRVVAVRLVLNLATRGPRETPTEDPFELLFSQVVVDGDPERDHLKRLYRPDVRAAFVEAARALPVRERNLLRAALVDGRSIDQIGALYGVHRSTAARWIAAAREQLQREFRRAMQERLGITEDQLDSFVALVGSQLDLSLERLFDDGP